MPFLILAILTPLLTAAGYLSRQPWLLPILQVLPAYPLMVLDLKHGRTGRAVAHMLAWAFLLAVTVVTLATFAPTAGEESVMRGTQYRDEMLRWIRTGQGKEGSVREFLPEHALHLGTFVALGLFSGGVLSLLLGALLMNYMSFYVGSLLAIAAKPSVILLFGWPPWAMLRVLGFVILGVVLAGPALHRTLKIPFAWDRNRAWILAAGVCILADVALKALLAQRWGGMLRSALFSLSGGL